MIKGEGSILLSELFSRLGIQENAAEAVQVVFSNEELVKVEHTGEDWLLTSFKPFRTDETLTITMADRRVIVIDVTDAGTITPSVTLSLSSQSTLKSVDQNGKYASFTADYTHEYSFLSENCT